MIRSLLASGNWRPFFKPLAKAAKDNDVAIFFGELCDRSEYYSIRGELTEDGFFFATIESLEEETNLSKYKQAKCTTFLEVHGLVESDLRGMPKRKFYRIPEDISSRWSNFLTNIGQKISLTEVKKFDQKKSNDLTVYKDLNKKDLNIDKASTEKIIETTEELKQELFKRKIWRDSPEARLAAWELIEPFLETTSFQNQWNFMTDRFPGVDKNLVVKEWVLKAPWYSVKKVEFNKLHGWIRKAYQNRNNGKTAKQPGRTTVSKYKGDYQ